ncbi:hypothetical protein [uncultured Jatrophihabitans sp.]|uniref:hypothetical protein n=1 Tax=uncultured Jatrophihabitans sp. TaxID=1610747 RepID=UPI0035CC6660
MTWFESLLGGIRDGAPHSAYVALLVGWRLLTVLTLITVLDMGYRLFRPDHGLKP